MRPINACDICGFSWELHGFPYCSCPIDTRGIEMNCPYCNITTAGEHEYGCLMEEIKTKEFPIGERRWCKKCANRIVKYLLNENGKDNRDS